MLILYKKPKADEKRKETSNIKLSTLEGNIEYIQRYGEKTCLQSTCYNTKFRGNNDDMMSMHV